MNTIFNPRKTIQIDLGATLDTLEIVVAKEENKELLGISGFDSDCLYFSVMDTATNTVESRFVPLFVLNMRQKDVEKWIN